MNEKKQIQKITKIAKHLPTDALMKGYDNIEKKMTKTEHDIIAQDVMRNELRKRGFVIETKK